MGIKCGTHRTSQPSHPSVNPTHQLEVTKKFHSERPQDNGLVTLPEDPVEQEADQIFAQRVAVAKAKAATRKTPRAES